MSHLSFRSSFLLSFSSLHVILVPQERLKKKFFLKISLCLFKGIKVCVCEASKATEPLRKQWGGAHRHFLQRE